MYVYRWNVVDVIVVLVSIISIIFNEMKMADAIPFNPSILTVCRVLRLAQGTHTLSKVTSYYF